MIVLAMTANDYEHESVSLPESMWPSDPRHEEPSRPDLMEEESQRCPPHVLGVGKTFPLWRLMLVYLRYGVAVSLDCDPDVLT